MLRTVTQTRADLCLASRCQEEGPFPCRNPWDSDPTPHRGYQTQRPPREQILQIQRATIVACVCRMGYKPGQPLLSFPSPLSPPPCRLSSAGLQRRGGI